MGEHLSQLVNPIVSESGDCLVGAIVDADDIPVGEIVVIADDRLKEPRILSKLFRDVVNGEDVGDIVSHGHSRLAEVG